MTSTSSGRFPQDEPDGLVNIFGAANCEHLGDATKSCRDIHQWGSDNALYMAPFLLELRPPRL